MTDHLLIRLTLIFITGWMFSCEKTTEGELEVTKLAIPVSQINTQQELGRVLFYDNNLSLNKSVSCASCHKQQFAFADNVALSRGFDNVLTTRNSMPIQNLSSGMFNDSFERMAFVSNGTAVGQLFWDGRETNLAEMVLKPIANHGEMGIRDFDWLVNRISRLDYYQQGFANVFGEESTIDKLTISVALASFVSSITSHETKLDAFFFGEEELSSQELEGMRLFFEKYDCNGCHRVQSPSGYLQAGVFANVGLDLVYEDPGLSEVTQRSSDNGSFKIPSLRNVAVTAPYMHDGRFETLDEVLEHYSDGISANPNLDTRLKEGDSPMVLNITNEEKRAIKAFLNTLTDVNMLTNPNYSNPFTNQP